MVANAPASAKSSWVSPSSQDADELKRAHALYAGASTKTPAPTLALSPSRLTLIPALSPKRRATSTHAEPLLMMNGSGLTFASELQENQDIFGTAWLYCAYTSIDIMSPFKGSIMIKVEFGHVMSNPVWTSIFPVTLNTRSIVKTNPIWLPSICIQSIQSPLKHLKFQLSET